MNKPYFVMIWFRRGDGVMALTEEDGETVKMFESSESAVEAANNCDAAVSLGYDVFCVGNGEDGGDPI